MDEKKGAVITGGGSGIGAAAAKRLAQDGITVCIMDVNEARAEEVQAEIITNGGDAFILDIDVKDEARVKAGMEQAYARLGVLGTVFVNAGVNGT